jgi:hypothetical protein
MSSAREPGDSSRPAASVGVRVSVSEFVGGKRGVESGKRARSGTLAAHADESRKTLRRATLVEHAHAHAGRKPLCRFTLVEHAHAHAHVGRKPPAALQASARRKAIWLA